MAEKIALVGHGYWGSRLARNLGELGCLGAVVDIDPEVAAAAARHHGVPAMDFEAMLADASIGGVCLASPAVVHFSQSRSALKAGKHVLVEKPLALETAHGEELCALAASSGLVLMVGHLLNYHPAFIELAARVRAGDFGALRYVSSNRLSLGKFRNEENVLWSFGPHDISMLLGLAHEEPSEVSAQGCVSFLPGIADLVTAQFAFAGGARGHIQLSWMHPFKEHRLTVIGEKAMGVFEDSRPWAEKLTIYRHDVDISGPVPLTRAAEPHFIELDQIEPLRRECADFVACMRTGAVPKSSGNEGLAVLRVLERTQAALDVSLGGRSSKLSDLEWRA